MAHGMTPWRSSYARDSPVEVIGTHAASTTKPRAPPASARGAGARPGPRPQCPGEGHLALIDPGRSLHAICNAAAAAYVAAATTGSRSPARLRLAGAAGGRTGRSPPSIQLVELALHKPYVAGAAGGPPRLAGGPGRPSGAAQLKEP